MNKIYILICFAFYFSISNFTLVFSQQSSTLIKKTDKTEIIDGKKYYAHFVEKGQTLYSIAKTYSVTVDILVANNQDLFDGLKTGSTLRIPFTNEIVISKKNVEKKSNATEPHLKTPVNSEEKQQPDSELKKTILNTATVDEITKPIGDIDVVLLLPITLANANDMDVNKIFLGDEKIPEETKSSLEFYEGFKMAFDSLRHLGFKGRLHVYDTNIDSIEFINLLKKSELKTTDLLICHFAGKKLETVLKFAKENNIMAVASAVQNNTILLGKQNVSKIIPSFVSQSEALANFTATRFAETNIILFNSTNPKDRPYLNTFKKTANPILLKSKMDTVHEITFTSLKNFTSKSKPNIVVVLSNNSSFISEAIGTLYLEKQETKDSIILVSMSNVNDIESIDFGYLNTLNTIVSSYNFLDYTDPSTKKIATNYLEEFKTDPTQQVFSGFDVGYFYLRGLDMYGNKLQKKLPELQQNGTQFNFHFIQSASGCGFENSGIGIFKFENFSYKKLN